MQTSIHSNVAMADYLDSLKHVYTESDASEHGDYVYNIVDLTQPQMHEVCRKAFGNNYSTKPIECAAFEVWGEEV